jgi:hypothetical protein
MKNKRKLIFLCLMFAFSVLYCAIGQTAENSPPNSIDGLKTSEYISISFMISVLILKITAFVLGYLIVRMGHDTLVKGITGEFDFGFSGSGFSTKLKSASPGLLFVLMGSLIIIWSMAAEKPLKISSTPSKTTEIATQNSVGQKDPIPDPETDEIGTQTPSETKDPIPDPETDSVTRK